MAWYAFSGLVHLQLNKKIFFHWTKKNVKLSWMVHIKMVDMLILKKKQIFLQKSTWSLSRSVIILFWIIRTFCLQRQDSLLSAKERITFSWSNLSVEVPGSDNKRCCGILPSKGEPRPPKQILKNGKDYVISGKDQTLCSASGIVHPGEFLAIMGASGAGKSTLLNTLLFRNLSGLKVKRKFPHLFV